MKVILVVVVVVAVFFLTKLAPLSECFVFHLSRCSISGEE